MQMLLFVSNFKKATKNKKQIQKRTTAMDIKKHIISHIKLDADFDFESLIVETQDKEKGDYSIPCFSLSKVLHKSPVDIANDIKNNYEQDELVDKIEVVNGYLNFYLNKQKFNELVIKDCQKDNYYTSNEFCGKTLCIDYSSVNLAKYMHIGHLSTTMIGESLARIYEKNGWKDIRKCRTKESTKLQLPLPIPQASLTSATAMRSCWQMLSQDIKEETALTFISRQDLTSTARRSRQEQSRPAALLPRSS